MDLTEIGEHDSVVMLSERINSLRRSFLKILLVFFISLENWNKRAPAEFSFYP